MCYHFKTDFLQNNDAHKSDEVKSSVTSQRQEVLESAKENPRNFFLEVNSRASVRTPVVT